MKHNIVVSVEHLHKAYNSVTAVDDVTFEVYEGEIFGMVGPNGAGKTTTIECIEGLREPASGTLRVLGLHPLKEKYKLRSLIGIQLQQSALQPRLKVSEALDLFSSFYERSVDPTELLNRLGIADKRTTYFSKLSGGQKQRLFIALALINDPELVFLDELTTGLDPQARHTMWDLVKEIRTRGKTVFLTTHFMEEAERLCDRVAIMDHGSIVALDSPENLVRSLGAQNRVIFTADGPFEMQLFKSIRTVSRVEAIGTRVTVHGQGDEMVRDVVNTLTASGVHYRDLRTEQPSLEDVYFAKTGQQMKD